MKLVSCVREKNSMRYLPRLIPQLRAISDLTIILDDHSTDGSFEWLTALSQRVTNLLVIQQPEQTFNGGRDWNILYRFAGQYDPEWIFCPDADELVEESEAVRVRDLIESSGKDIRGWSFPFYYLWNDEQHYRNQGKYHNTKVIRLFRYEPNMKPPNRISHTYGTPDDIDRRLIRIAPIRMWHFGYMLAEDRKVKYNFYTDRDKDPLAAGSGGTDYNHIAEDNPLDLVEVPTLVDWLNIDKLSTGSFLDRAPYRVAVGSAFPSSKLITLDALELLPADCVDEIRINFVLDGESFDVLKFVLQWCKKALRPGGRLEIVAVDFVALCNAYVQGNDQKKTELASRFLLTPHRVPFKTLYFHNLISLGMQDEGYQDWQQVPLPEFPYRLNMICYKPGEDKWF